MTIDKRDFGGAADETERDWGAAARRGFALRCPCCGGDRLLTGLLKVRAGCGVCGLDYRGHRADDLPPYLTILIVAHIVVPGVWALERLYEPSMAFSMIFWSSWAVALCLLLLPRIKGAVIGVQWANRMHGFGDGDGWSDHVEPEPTADAGASDAASR